MRFSVSATLTLNQVFLDNMRQLWRHDARLAQRIDELPLGASLKTEPSRQGPMTARVETGDGRKLYLHSRHDPVREAADFCRGLEADDAACVVLCGLGLGYHLTALTKQFGEDTIILVSEPDLVTIKTALETTNLTDELAHGNVEFLTTLDKAGLHERLSGRSSELVLGTVFAVPPAGRNHNAEFHAECRRAVTDFASFAKMSVMTLVRNAGLTCRNVANNLPTYLTTPPADVLLRRFAGYPAILVAAGPSLTRNIDQLKELQDRAVIIAAQTTLGPLLSRGIRPHFVTSLDFSDLSRHFFEGIEIPEEVVLVAEPKASWHTVDAFLRSGGGRNRLRRVVLLDNRFAHRCVGEHLARRTPMRAGSTVMHLAMYLAQWMGCDPIIFIGQDLAFTGHSYYAPGVAMHRAWAPEMGRYCTLEMKEFERIVRQRSLIREVKDIHGHPIFTDDQMFTYLQQFERDFAKCAAKVIDATEGGVRKAGAEVMPLRKAVELHCRRPLDPSCFAYLKSNWSDRSRLCHGRDALADRLEKLGAFGGLCQETRDLLEELAGLLDSPREFNRKIVRIDELRTLVQSHALLFEMVRDVSQLAELQKFAADRQLAADEATGKTKARRQLARDRRFIDALLEGRDRLEGILKEALQRFDDALKSTGAEGSA
jgi:hypothetical protein